MWREMDDSSEVVAAVSGVVANTDACIARLKANNIFQVAKRSVNDQVEAWLDDVWMFGHGSPLISYRT
jgi:hypothetical protein